MHNLRGHRGCALASVGPAADKVPVNGKCCVGFRKGLGLSPIFTEPLAQSLPSLLWLFFKTLCDVLCVVMYRLCPERCVLNLYIVLAKHTNLQFIS